MRDSCNIKQNLLDFKNDYKQLKIITSKTLKNFELLFLIKNINAFILSPVLLIITVQEVSRTKKL